MATLPRQDSDDQDGSQPDLTQGNSDLSPIDGGQWRPVRPEELLLKNQPAEGDDDRTEPPAKVTLERRQELEQHLKASPTDRDAYLELAAIYRDQHRPQDARRTLEQASQIFPDDEKLLWELEEATLARSLQQFREVSDLASRLKTSEADRELQRSRHDWACRRIDVCRARLKRDPSRQQLRVVLGEAMYDAQMYEEALAEMTTAANIDEYAPQAHLIRGRCLLALGKDLEAMSALRAATLRRAVPAPLRIKIAGLKLLCETAQRLGVDLTLQRYRQQLQVAEQELAGNTQAAASPPHA
jgi:tetratricopeptide (TPR) repeat protein